MTYLDDENMSDCSSVSSNCSYQSEINEEHKSINFNLNEGAPIDTNDFNIVHYNLMITLRGARCLILKKRY